MVSLPGYDNNAFAQGISTAEYRRMLRDPDRPMLNLAIGEQYPPGSTYKLVTGTGALQDRKICRDDADPHRAVHPDRPLEVLGLEQGGLRLGEHLRRVRPLERHVLLPARGMLGIDRLAYWAHQFGFGAPTGIDLPGEVVGHRADERLEAARAQPDLLHRRALPGRHRAGLRRGHPAPAPERVRRARERRHALSPAARAPHPRRGGRRGRGRSCRRSSASSTSTAVSCARCAWRAAAS